MNAMPVMASGPMTQSGNHGFLQNMNAMPVMASGPMTLGGFHGFKPNVKLMEMPMTQFRQPPLF